MQDQDARSRRVVQVGPSEFDFFQLAEGLAAKHLNGVFISRVHWVCTELPVEVLPGDPQRALEREGPVGEPQVEIQP